MRYVVAHRALMCLKTVHVLLHVILIECVSATCCLLPSADLCVSTCLSKEEACVDVLKAYISLLIRDQQTELVASYVGQLPAELATTQYAAFLETVNQPELRPRCLELATEAGETGSVEANTLRTVTTHISNQGILNVFFCLCRSGCRCSLQAGGGDRKRERRL